MKWIRLFWVALFAAIILTGCGPTVQHHHENSKTGQISDTILDEMEGPPKNGHTLERHVGKSNDELQKRVKSSHVSAASTYYDKKTATKAVLESLHVHEQEIEHWLEKSNRDRLVLKTHHSFAVGKTVLRSDMRVHEELHDTITVLAKDPSSDLKYKIITSYPILKRGR
ncbi:RNase A-like domain-containing lipoprotein [Fictibacillus gelatini]|uniref:RNase A-like domain-containing lipoprotein n=1 Tax=Fictibacillus gelatini TaxID=225985 RepID=UPI0003F77FCA|nr:RNase A-like domain-containing lipoprotein [Fictibacillus gelatini]